MKVYLASSGSYSDYSVDCAFTTLELAIEYVAHRNDVPIDIQRQAYDLDTEPYTRQKAKARQELERAHPQLHSYDAHFVEERDLFDTLPIVEQA